MEYNLKEILPKIFCVSTNCLFDLAFLFLRYQEYYESPNENFRRKSFTIIDYIEWYSKTKGSGAFTYSKDWEGFNIPSSILIAAQKEIPDFNKYDEIMLNITKEIELRLGSTTENYYLIGVLENDLETRNHEIAHALYAINKDYKIEMEITISELDKPICKQAKKVIWDMGYCEEVLVDELQAYISTGLPEELDHIISKDEIEKFKFVFDKYAYKERAI